MSDPLTLLHAARGCFINGMSVLKHPAFGFLTFTEASTLPNCGCRVMMGCDDKGACPCLCVGGGCQREVGGGFERKAVPAWTPGSSVHEVVLGRWVVVGEHMAAGGLMSKAHGRRWPDV